MTNPRKITVGLLWHSTNSGNLGVGALTVGNLGAARDAARAVDLDVSFKIIEFEGDFGGAYVSGDGIETFQINRRSMMSPKGYWALLKTLDCILDIGAGDSYTDIYGPKRFAYLSATKELARLRGVPLLFSPQTIGPFTRQPYKAVASHQMTKAVAVVARDPQSMAAIGELAPAARALQSVDVAFRLPYSRPERRKGGRLKVGVNVSGLLFNDPHRFGLEADYPATMRAFIAAVQSRGDAEVHLVCHVNSSVIAYDDDGAVADRLGKEFPATVRAPNFTSPSDAKSYIAGLDFLTAGRMHACIAAFSAGVPVVPIAYSRKFAGLFEGVLGYPFQVPVVGMTTDAAVAYLLSCLDRRAELALAINEGQKTVAAAEEIYDLELQQLFRRIASNRQPGRMEPNA